MSGTTANIDDLSRAVTDLAVYLERGKRSAEGVEQASKEILKNIDGVAGLNPLLAWTKGFSAFAANLQNTSSKLRKDSVDAAEKLLGISKRIAEKESQRVFFQKQLADAKADKDVPEAKNAAWTIANLTKGLEALRAEKAKTEATFAVVDGFHEKLTKEVWSIRDAWTNISSMWAVTLTTKAFQMVSALGSSYKQANTTLAERNRLLKTGLQAVAETGLKMETVQEAQKALIDLGMEDNANHLATVKTIGMLHEGLDVSIQNATQLANVSAVLNQNFGGLADSVAAIARYTGLSADEATKYAVSVGRSVQIFGTTKRTGLDLKALTQEVNEMEGALKGVTGLSGDFTSLIEAINKGSVRGELFGLQSSKVQSAGDFKNVEATIKRYSDMLQNTPNVARTQVAEGISSSVFGGSVTAATLLAYNDVLRKRVEIDKAHGPIIAANNEAMLSYQMNLNESGKSLDGLRQAVWAAAVLALVPMTGAVRSLTGTILELVNGLKSFLDQHERIKAAVKALVGKAGLGLLVLTLTGLAYAAYATAIKIRQSINLLNAAMARINGVPHVPSSGTPVPSIGKWSTRFGYATIALEVAQTIADAISKGDADSTAGKIATGLQWATAAAGIASLVGALKAILPSIAALRTGFSLLYRPIKWIADGLQYIGPILGFVSRGLFAFANWARLAATAAEGLAPVFEVLATVAETIAGVIAAIATLPAWAIVAIVAAVAAIGYAIYKNWDWLRARLEQFNAWLISIATAGVHGVASLWKTIAGYALTAWNFVLNKLIDMIENVPWLGAKLKSSLDAARPIEEPGKPGAPVARSAEYELREQRHRELLKHIKEGTQATEAQTDDSNSREQKRTKRAVDEKNTDRPLLMLSGGMTPAYAA